MSVCFDAIRHLIMSGTCVVRSHNENFDHRCFHQDDSRGRATPQLCFQMWPLSSASRTRPSCQSTECRQDTPALPLPNDLFTHPFVGWIFGLLIETLRAASGISFQSSSSTSGSWHHPTHHTTTWRKERYMRTIETKGKEERLIMFAAKLLGDPGGCDVICKL